MPFQSYLCWQKSRVDTVMDPDAERVPDDVFLAVHSEHPLNRMDASISNRAAGRPHRWQMPAREFLKQFLDPDQHHVQAVIQGESGSGKSHLIKWLGLNIAPASDRYVLTIPKAGMSLRKIVERIIDALPESKQGVYRERLNQVGYHTATRDQLRERLMNRIAEAIKADTSQDLDDQDLAERLPDIFYDPHLRDVLDERGGVIDELVAHVFEGSKQYERRERQRLFQVDDLPLRFQDIKQMSRKAADMLSELVGDAELTNRALALINRSLKLAIPQALHFTGNQLEELMLDLRRHLRSEGKQLILLIEDFARLQGIDGALLQALIEAGSPENGLCDMRWAMAVTRGYYETIPTTVQTRVQFLIDMDLSTSGDNRVLSDDDIVAFGARYLAAVRLEPEHLNTWYVTRADSASAAPVPNACETCRHRQECHAAFGAVGEVGLYPFTRKALLNMARRQDAKLDERFNPRVLIKDVMRVVLAVHGEELERGQFPSKLLLDSMGGSQMKNLDVDRLKRDNPEQYLRQQALLDLWSERPGVPDPLPEGIYEAFRLAIPRAFQPQLVKPLPGIRTVVVTPDPEQDTHLVPTPPPSLPPVQRTVLDQRVDAVNEWGRGGTLTEGVAAVLRELIYQAVETRIEWDAAGLEKTAFTQRVSNVTPFRMRNIIFRRQPTESTVGALGVSLRIPQSADDEDELRESALALEGLMRYNDRGDWQFDGGAESLAALGECLKRWSDELVRQFRTVPDGEGAWDPVPAAVEVLSLGAALAGRPPKPDAPLAEQVNALFEPWPADATDYHLPDWQDLYKSLFERQEDLRAILFNWASGTKGGQGRSFMDPSRIVPTLVAVRENWTLRAGLPDAKVEKRDDKYGRLSAIHRRLPARLTKAVTGELERRKAWLQQVSTKLPLAVPWAESLSTFKTLLQSVRENDLGQMDVRSAFDAALQAAEPLPFEQLVAQLRRAETGEDSLATLPQMAKKQVGQQMLAVDRLCLAADRFLKEVEAAVQTKEASFGVTATLEADQRRIQESLDRLDKCLEALGGNYAN